MRPLYQRLQRPLRQMLQRRCFNENGRLTERPYNRYTSCCTTTDALPLDTPVRPHSGLRVSTERFHGGLHVSSLLISQDCCTFEE